MGKTYQKADKKLVTLTNSVVKRWHDRLRREGFEVSIEVLVVYAAVNKDGESSGTAITVGGHEAAACVRVTTLEERVAGRADAVIWIDGDRRKNWSVGTLTSILDHEITHLEIIESTEYDDEGRLKPDLDDAGRPRLRLRKHDFQVGWFDEVAERHGEYSYEVLQARTLVSRQMYFPGFDIWQRNAGQAS